MRQLTLRQLVQRLASQISQAWQRLFGLLSVALALPVLLYCSTDYLTGAWRALRHRSITIDVPIALGIWVLFSRSLFEILAATPPLRGALLRTRLPVLLSAGDPLRLPH